MSENFKLKATQFFAYAVSAFTLLYSWNTGLFITSLILGWLLFLLGHSASLHKYSSHKCITPRNRLCKLALLFFGTIATLGSSIAWTLVHRHHHAYTDTDKDPHNPNGSVLHIVKIWFYFFKTAEYNPKIVKDLLKDKDHLYFHKNYFKIIFAYCAILAFVDPILVGYFYAIPVLYTMIGSSYNITFAHLKGFKLGYRNVNTDDYSLNSQVTSLLFPGDGNHNNHHARPELASNKLTNKDIDIALPVIKLFCTIKEDQ